MTAFLSHTESDRRAMLEVIGARSIDELFGVIPDELRAGSLGLPARRTEQEVRRDMEDLASQNRPYGSKSFLGAGCYNHYVPSSVGAIVGRTEFSTAYTPYQAEVSQGTLQHIFEFQTMITALTGLDVANASMYDAFTALAEAAFLALRSNARDRIVISEGVHPEARGVVRTYAAGPGFPVAVASLDPDHGRTRIRAADLEAAGALLVQQPNVFGVIEDLTPLAQAAHEVGCLLVVSQNPLTLGLLESPGALGADVAVGDVQVFGGRLNFGGPSAGYLACRKELVRQLPGRLVGQTVDLDGRLCYTLTLQAREQHIRRARATSNICSNQALNALAATVYLALLGPHGLHDVGAVCVRRAHHLQRCLCALPGMELVFDGPFFHEFALRLPGDAGEFAERMRELGVDPGVPLGRFESERPEGAPPAFLPRDTLLVAVTESNMPEDLECYLDCARRVLAGRTP